MFEEFIKFGASVVFMLVGAVSLAIALDESAHGKIWPTIKFLLMGIFIFGFGLYLLKNFTDKIETANKTEKTGAYCLIIDNNIDYNHCIARDIIEGKR